MAVTITKLSEGRTSNYDGKGLREYQQTFRVVTDSLPYGPLAAEMAVANQYTIVQNLTYYDEGNSVVDLAALAESIRGDPEYDDNPFRFLVSVVYSTRVYDSIAQNGGATPTSPQQGGNSPSSSENASENPLLQPAELSITTQERMRVVYLDLNGNAVLNAAGEPFDPPKEAPDAFLVITITRNEATTSPVEDLKYINAINEVILGSFAAGTAICKGISGTASYWHGLRYWKRTYIFHVTDDVFGWLRDEIMLEHGWNYLSGRNNDKDRKLMPCVNKVGDRIDGLLSHTDGRQLLPGFDAPSYTFDIDNQGNVLPTYRFFKRADFSPLGLDTLMTF